MLSKVILLCLLGSLEAGYHEFEDKHSAPQPYRFGYEVKDKEGAQYRHEEGDGHGSVKGSYGYTDDKGIYREVHYVADKQGFRAKINTNEPGTSNQDSADVEIQSNAKHQEYHAPTHQFHEHHSPVYHTADITPVYHKVSVAPIRPLKHIHNNRGYSFNNFSPIHGFSYKPHSFLSHKPISGYNNGFRNGYRGHPGTFNIYNTFGHNDNAGSFGKLDSYNHAGIETIVDDLKNNKHISNIDSFSGTDNFKNINGFNNFDFDNFDGHSNIESFSNIGEFGKSYGFEGANKDNIEKLIEEAKNKNNHGYSSNHGKFNDNSNFYIKEFRNIGDHKYSRSSDGDFSN